MTDEELRERLRLETRMRDQEARLQRLEARRIDPRTAALARIGAGTLALCAAIGAAITTAPQAALERVADAFGCAVHGEPAERGTRGAGEAR